MIFSLLRAGCSNKPSSGVVRVDTPGCSQVLLLVHGLARRCNTISTPWPYIPHSFVWQRTTSEVTSMHSSHTRDDSTTIRLSHGLQMTSNCRQSRHEPSSPTDIQPQGGQVRQMRARLPSSKFRCRCVCVCVAHVCVYVYVWEWMRERRRIQEDIKSYGDRTRVR